MGQYDIGDYLKRRLAGQPLEIDAEEVWADLDLPKKKRRRGFWWFFGMAGVLLISAGIYFGNVIDSEDEHTLTELSIQDELPSQKVSSLDVSSIQEQDKSSEDGQPISSIGTQDSERRELNTERIPLSKTAETLAGSKNGISETKLSTKLIKSSELKNQATLSGSKKVQSLRPALHILSDAKIVSESSVLVPVVEENDVSVERNDPSILKQDEKAKDSHTRIALESVKILASLSTGLSYSRFPIDLEKKVQTQPPPIRKKK